MAKRPQKTQFVKDRRKDRFSPVTIRANTRRNPVARNLVTDRQFRPRTIPSGARYRRHPKYKERFKED